MHLPLVHSPPHRLPHILTDIVPHTILLRPIHRITNLVVLLRNASGGYLAESASPAPHKVTSSVRNTFIDFQPTWDTGSKAPPARIIFDSLSGDIRIIDAWAGVNINVGHSDRNDVPLHQSHAVVK
jgi:hypothetical protein